MKEKKSKLTTRTHKRNSICRILCLCKQFAITKTSDLLLILSTNLRNLLAETAHNLRIIAVESVSELVNQFVGNDLRVKVIAQEKRKNFSFR